jgi:hypothetical protein
MHLFLRPVRILPVIALLVFGLSVQAQITADSLPQADSVRLRMADSLRRLDSLFVDSLAKVPPPIRDSIRPILQFPFDSDSFLYRKRLFFSFTDPVRYNISEREWTGKEVIFYGIIALLIIFALIKNSFRRYLPDLFSSYFRTTVRQRQIKEQLLQSPLPSLLFNIFFVLSGGLFLSLLLQQLELAEDVPFWILAVYCAVALALVYTGKFLLLKFFGWAFRMAGATDTYIFVIFSTNKILGILLLPFTILLAFTYGSVNGAAVTLSLIMVGCLFLYRYFLVFISINRMVQINFFHFLLYLAAFEIVPVLLINKLLFLFLREIY